MKREAILVLLLVLPATLLVPSDGTAASSTSGAEEAPWWGPSDRSDRTQGFHFRIPLLVSNPHDFPLKAPVALAELDIGQLLVDAGWNARSLGSSAFPTSFTLDPDSIRVIPYGTGFGSIASQEPLPSRFYPGRFSQAREASFDPSRNPVGTVAFRVDQTLAPGEAQPYMIYFASEQQEGRQPETGVAPVDGWPSRGWGTRAYGFPTVEGAGIQPRLDVVAQHPGTKVTVFTYQGGQPQEAKLPNTPNPFTLGAGASQTIKVPSFTFYKVEATKPVLTAGRGEFTAESETFGGGGFVPAENGMARGNAFHVPVYTPRLVATLAQQGNTEVSVEAEGQTATAQLGTGSPSATFDLPAEEAPTSIQTAHVTSSKRPILLQYGPPLVGTHDVPSRASAAGGTDLVPVAPQGNQLEITASRPTELRVVQPGGSSQQLFPFGEVGQTPPEQLSPFPSQVEVETNESFPEQQPVRVLSTGTEEGPPAPVHVSVGAGSQAGAFLLDANLTTYVEGPVAVVGAYDGTRVTVERARVGGETSTDTQTVNRDGVVVLESLPDTRPTRISASKPVSVLPIEGRDQYARVQPSFGAGPEVQTKGLQFRGALVQMDVEEAVGGQVVKTIGPGQTVSFDVSVRNVGHWTAGSSITETVEVTCGDAGSSWSIEGCGRSLTLASDQSRTNRIEITATDVRPGQRLSLGLEAHGEHWNTTDSSQVILLVRKAFGVESWFFAEGGPTDLRDAPTFVDPGETTRVPFVVKNTGTVEDTYSLGVFPPNEGWTIEALQDGEPTQALTLPADETARLAFRITSSKDPTVLSTPVQLEIASTSDELTFDKLRGRAQIATELNMSVDSPEPVARIEPGTRHAFPIHVTNEGDSIISVQLNATPSVPPGWSVDVPVPSISVFPGNRTTLNVTVSTPPDAPALERGTISALVSAARSPGEKPTERRLVLTALVEQMHDIRFPSEPIPVDAGPEANLQIPLSNSGNGNETVRVLGTSPSWPFTTPGPLPVSVNDTATLPIDLDVPSQTAPGRTNLTVHLSLSRSVQRNLTLPLQVRKTPGLQASLPEARPLLPGKPTTLPVVVESAGNVRLHGSPTIATPGNWTVNATPERLSLPPGGKAEVTFTLQAPDNVPPGTTEVTPRIERPNASVVDAGSISLPVGRTDLSLQAVRQDRLSQGDLLVRARLANNGSVPAHGVDVGLLSEDEQIATTTVQRLNPGETTPVTVSTTASDVTGSHLVADPSQELADPDRSNNVVPVGEAETPQAWPLVLLATASAALLGRWRL